MNSRGTLWASTTQQAGDKAHRVHPYNQVVWERTLVILEGAIISGMLGPKSEVSYIR